MGAAFLPRLYGRFLGHRQCFAPSSHKWPTLFHNLRKDQRQCFPPGCVFDLLRSVSIFPLSRSLCFLKYFFIMFICRVRDQVTVVVVFDNIQKRLLRCHRCVGKDSSMQRRFRHFNILWLNCRKYMGGGLLYSVRMQHLKYRIQFQNLQAVTISILAASV